MFVRCILDGILDKASRRRVNGTIDIYGNYFLSLKGGMQKKQKENMKSCGFHENDRMSFPIQQSLQSTKKIGCFSSGQIAIRRKAGKASLVDDIMHILLRMF